MSFETDEALFKNGTGRWKGIPKGIDETQSIVSEISVVKYVNRNKVWIFRRNFFLFKSKHIDLKNSANVLG